MIDSICGGYLLHIMTIKYRQEQPILLSEKKTEPAVFCAFRRLENANLKIDNRADYDHSDGCGAGFAVDFQRQNQ